MAEGLSPGFFEAQERELLVIALQRAGGNHERAAELLGVSVEQLQQLLEKRAAADAKVPVPPSL